jgi:hypothetical protein
VNAFSERFLNALRSRLPGLLPQVRPLPDAEAIELRVPAPSGHGELSVTTIGDEVTRWDLGPGIPISRNSTIGPMVRHRASHLSVL